jgi:hypothetical protein
MWGCRDEQGNGRDVAWTKTVGSAESGWWTMGRMAIVHGVGMERGSDRNGRDAWGRRSVRRP